VEPSTERKEAEARPLLCRAGAMPCRVTVPCPRPANSAVPSCCDLRCLREYRRSLLLLTVSRSRVCARALCSAAEVSAVAECGDAARVAVESPRWPCPSIRNEACARARC
jgi:hypothetical protein